MFRFQPSVESLETRETPSVAVSGRITGIAADPTPKADPLPVLLVIADRHDFSPVSSGDMVAGGGDPGVAGGGVPGTPRPTIILQRLANPGAPNTANGDYTAIVFVGGWGSSGI
jgi:hypothetical protein